MTSIHSEVIAYLDGSGLNGQIGAAMVLYKGKTEQGTLRKHIGSEERHTIFKAELLGLSLAAKLIKTKAHIQSAVIIANSQAVILVTRHTKGAPGCYELVHCTTQPTIM